MPSLASLSFVLLPTRHSPTQISPHDPPPHPPKDPPPASSSHPTTLVHPHPTPHPSTPDPTPLPPGQDMSSYEETRIKKDPDTWGKYLKEGMDVQLLLWNGKVRALGVPRASGFGRVGVSVWGWGWGGVEQHVVGCCSGTTGCTLRQCLRPVGGWV